MMPARESLLDAAFAALAHRPWAAVRMVDVASAAGVSRQTLYNEFGSKEGLARALVRREADAYLAGVERALGVPGDGPERLVAVAEWTVSAARGNAVVRALLTGCWSARLPALNLAAVASSSAVPAQRRADAALPSPADLVAAVRDRAAAATAVGGGNGGEAGPVCEVAVRLALSCVAAPPGAWSTVGELVRGTLHRQGADREVPSPPPAGS
ncbi:TetR/AcrR family transcriptional regulator [Streptomyces sp. Tue 6430]|nr:TetR/AcrR family transcriptional regulator [Streptomyces sp. Tue 6430]